MGIFIGNVPKIKKIGTIVNLNEEAEREGEAIKYAAGQIGPRGKKQGKGIDKDVAKALPRRKKVGLESVAGQGKVSINVSELAKLL